jgi:exopolysaccharide biosynthesis protein
MSAPAGKDTPAGIREQVVTKAPTGAGAPAVKSSPAGTREQVVTKAPDGAGNTGKKGLVRKRKRRKWLTVANILAALALLYCIAVFSNIPFVKTLRDLYIETAMETYSHKWLATFFIPGYIIDDVMTKKAAYIEEQQDLHSSWAPTSEPPASPSPSPTADSSATPTLSEQEQARLDFLERFYEIEPASFDEYMARHAGLLDGGYDKLLINEAGLDDEGTGIYTKNGDELVVIDAENGLLIAVVKGEGYEGKLAIVRQPEQVRLGVSTSLGSYGQLVGQIAKNNNAVLAINASGFIDPEGKGNGGEVVGLLIAGGKKYNGPIKSGYLPIGFGYDDRFYIGLSTSETDYRDAIEFVPAIVINGEDVTAGSTGFGIHPRSSIGQAEDGTVFLLTIDGRQVGYSLGTTVAVCADILLDYGAVQASNLDGGSSTVMVYRDEVITRPSGPNPNGRYVPDAFIVDYAGEA